MVDFMFSCHYLRFRIAHKVSMNINGYLTTGEKILRVIKGHLPVIQVLNGHSSKKFATK